MLSLKGREAFEVDMSWIKKVAIMYYIERGLLELIEDFECPDARVRIEEGWRGDVVRLCCCGSELEAGASIPSLGEAIDEGLIEKYYVESSCCEGLGIAEIQFESYSTIVKNFHDVLTPYVGLTHGSGVEYLFVVFKDGRGLVLEGEANKISVPLKNSLFIVHTHPGSCLPSPHDVRSIINLLLEGGFGGGVQGVGCYFLILRKGFFTEEDLMEIIEFKNALSSGDYDRVNAWLRFGKLSSNLYMHTNYLSIRQV